jgi:acyl-CoA synthetase (NDP forming)
MEPKEWKDLDKFFYPQSVAVIGASADPKKTGNAWVKNFMQ